MKRIRRPALCIIALASTLGATAAARAETDACTLLAPAQVGKAVGDAVRNGTHVVPSFVKTCTWLPAGKSRIGSVTLNLQTAAFYDGARRQATIAAGASGAGIKPASAGDEAYYFERGDQVALFVKKGAVSYKVAVYARIPVREKEAMELELAKEVAGRM